MSEQSPPSFVLPLAETLNVEFKSDLKRLPDDELIEALVCLANTDGGELWLGVEDDGTPTGLHSAHQNLTGLPGLVAARTSPALAITVDAHAVSGVHVASAYRSSQVAAFRRIDYQRDVFASPYQAGRHSGVCADVAT